MLGIVTALCLASIRAAAVDTQSGRQFVEISAHHLSVNEGPHGSTGRLMRRDSTKPTKKSKHGAGKTHEVQWGGYKFDVGSSTTKCTEEGTDSLEGKSFFRAWSGSEGGLTLTEGTTIDNDVITKTPHGLQIYKAACPNSTTVTVGGVMDIPSGAESLDVVFGITRKCTGDCAPFMVSILDGETDEVRQRWCYNREGEAHGIHCHHNLTVPLAKWSRLSLNISNFTAGETAPRLALEIYTSGDFNKLPALPGQKGIGGRAMVLVDALTFAPNLRPEPNTTLKTPSRFCRQSLRDVCPESGWCMDKFRCSTGWCTEGSTRCNGVRNCNDDSDEVGCEQLNGFRGEYYVNGFSKALHENRSDMDNLPAPDFRILHQEIDFDTSSFRRIVNAHEDFAARWSGNVSISKMGHYTFIYPNEGTAKLRLRGIGTNAGRDFDAPSNSWVKLHGGDYELTLTYLHRNNAPSMTLKYAGPDTNGTKKVVPKSVVRAMQTGARCDTLMCDAGQSLIAKPGNADYLCKGAPCVASVDTATCCTRQYKVVAAGDFHTCALDMRGRPVCWGSNSGSKIDEWKNHTGPFKDISTRGQYTCGVFQDNGTVDCWTPDGTSTPKVDYSLGGRFTNITVGGVHTCALRDSGYPACTGTNTDHQIDPPSNLEFSQLTSGESFTCGILVRDYSVKCWGANDRGQATPPTGKDYFSYSHVSAGKFHACGITDGAVSCWGANDDGQATPPSGKNFKQVAAGGRHSCGLKEKGDIECWGANTDGQAAPVKEDAPFLAVSAGTSHTCAIRQRDREVVCWGSNFEKSSTGESTWVGQSEPPPAGVWP